MACKILYDPERYPHQRVPYLIPWTSPTREKWYAIVIPGNGNPGRMPREVFYYQPDGHCSGWSKHHDPQTLTEVSQSAKQNLRMRSEAKRIVGTPS